MVTTSLLVPGENLPSSATAGTASNPAGGVHGSMRVPPQDDSTKPTGTCSSLQISRAKKYATAEQFIASSELELHMVHSPFTSRAGSTASVCPALKRRICGKWSPETSSC